MKLFFKKSFGAEGENIARKYLKKKGLKFLCKNYVFHKKEIDLIFLDKEKKTIIFVEVKSRHNLKYGLPEESIHIFKRKNIMFAVKGFMLSHPQYKDYDVRLDTISILIENGETKINHLENSF